MSITPFVEVSYHEKIGYQIDGVNFCVTFPWYQRKDCLDLLQRHIISLRKIDEDSARVMAICLCAFARSGKTHRITPKDSDEQDNKLIDKR